MIAVDQAKGCDSCPLKAACPCYSPGRRACAVGANIVLSLWTAVMLTAVMFAALAAAIA